MIDKIVTSGTFSLDGGTWDVDNNVWIIGSASEVIVVDAAHDAAAIARRVGDREVRAIVCTHAHDDHIDAAAELAAKTGAPVLLHPADQVLWEMVYADLPYTPLEDGQTLSAGGVELTVLHTPGHSPGAVCLYGADICTVFSGDTLFRGGPGATGRSFSSFDTIIESIKGRLLTLPPSTVVHTGHGASTVIGEEAGHLDEWLARGH